MLPPINVPSRTERQKNVPRDTRAPAGFRREMSLWGHNMGSQGSRPDNYRELSGQPLIKLTGYDIVFWPSARQLIKNVSPKTGSVDGVF